MGELRSQSYAVRPKVQRLSEHKVIEVKARLMDLDHLQRELEGLPNLCRGSAAGCPILDGLETCASD